MALLAFFFKKSHLVPWHYLKEKTNAFFGLSLGFMLPQNPKKFIYLKKKKVKIRILPGTECENKKKRITFFMPDR